MRLSGFCLTLALSIGVMPACSSPAGPSARSGRPTIAAPVAVAPQGSLLIGDLDQPIPVPSAFRIGPAIVSGPYRMTIDATGLGCGDLFARPIIVDAVLTRTGQKISFNRPGNGWCGSFPGADCGGVSGTFAGSTFTGTATFQK